VYKQIEKDFRNWSHVNEHNKIFLTSIVLAAIALFIMAFNLWIGIALLALTLILNPLYIIQKTKDKTWNPVRLVKNFRGQQMKHDYKLLAKIIVEFGVNTKEKLLEVIRHYQAVLPRTSNNKGIYVTFFALAVAVLPHLWNGFEMFYYLFNEPHYNPNIQESTIISFITTISIIVVGVILLSISRMTGYIQEHLYGGHPFCRIEGVLSFMYFDDSFDLKEFSDLADEDDGETARGTYEESSNQISDEIKCNSVQSNDIDCDVGISMGEGEESEK